MNAVTREMADVLLQIDQYWIDRFPSGPESLTRHPTRDAELRNLWNDVRAVLAKSDVTAYEAQGAA